MDIKKLARIVRPGHRIDGDRSRTVRGAGWEFYHAAADDASRVACGDVLPGERKEDAVAFLLRAVAFFGSRGVRVGQLMTNNGGCYRSKRFRRTLRELGIGHIFTRPYTPGTNGKVERFIRTSLAEWAHDRSHPHSRVRTEVLRVWLRYYNLRRRHAAIGRLTPMQRLVKLRVTNVLGIYRARTSPETSPPRLRQAPTSGHRVAGGHRRLCDRLWLLSRSRARP